MSKSKKAKGFKAAPDEIGRDGEGEPAQSVYVRPVICVRCKSPRRTPFRHGRATVKDFDSMQFDKKLGVPFNRIIYRRCKCLDCGQVMIVSELTMQPIEEPNGRR